MKRLEGKAIEDLLEKYGFDSAQLLTSDYIRALEMRDRNTPVVLRLVELEGQDEDWYVDSYTVAVESRYDSDDDYDAYLPPTDTVEELVRQVVELRDMELKVIDYEGLGVYNGTEFY